MINRISIFFNVFALKSSVYTYGELLFFSPLHDFLRWTLGIKLFNMENHSDGRRRNKDERI